MSGNVEKWEVRLGDTQQIEIQLTGLDEIPPAATVEAYVVNGEGIETFQLAGASVTDYEERTVSIPLAAWLADGSTIEDTYRLRVRINDLTWPEYGRAVIRVEPRNAGVTP